MAEKTKKEETNKNCPCIYSCERHGRCRQCQAHHHAKGENTQCGK